MPLMHVNDPWTTTRIMNETFHFTRALAYLIVIWCSSYPEIVLAETLGPISEETAPAECDPDSYLSRIQCTGKYCDNIEIQCKKIGNRPVHTEWTTWGSEEQGGIGCPPLHVVTGLACNGKYCDNISLRCTWFEHLSTCRNPVSTVQISEENRNYVSVNENENFDKAGQEFFAVGITCSGRYCDNVGLEVCEVQSPRRTQTAVPPPPPPPDRPIDQSTVRDHRQDLPDQEIIECSKC